MNNSVVNQGSVFNRSPLKNKSIAKVLYLLAFGLMALLVIWLNLSWRPDDISLPPDSGFYAYIGKAVIHGQLLYRDVWDDKPPLGYYLNALGQLAFGQTPWGVWWSSVVWIFGCLLLLFFVIKRLFGGGTALITCLLFLFGLMNPQIFQGGNLMEVYALAPQIAIIGITYLFFTHQHQTGYALLVGMLTACAFLIKQPTVMLGFSAYLVIIVSLLYNCDFRWVVRIVFGFIAGFVGFIALVSLYWLQAGALSQLLDGLFLQGFSFIGGSQSNFISNFIHALVKALPALYIGKLYLIALLAFVFFIIEKFYQAHRESQIHQALSPIEWTWLIALLALPLECFSVSLGGKYYGHYFITMLPAVSLAIAYPLWRVFTLSRQSFTSKRTLLQNGVYILLGLGILIWGLASFIKSSPAPRFQTDLGGIFKEHIYLSDVEKYIIQTTHPSDEVLVWHIHLRINFTTDRSAPTRFLYPLNLFIPPSPQNTKLQEFVSDLENRPPALIVVQHPSSLGLPFVDTPLDELCKSPCTPDFVKAIKVPQILQQWLRFQQFFEAHYTLDTQINDWVIYRRLP